jgi:catalase
MADLATQLIDAFVKDFPEHRPGTRPVHAKGVLAIGLFRGSHEAERYCIAPHFKNVWTNVSVRFSNGNGSMDPDAARQVRGMAVKFHIGEVGGGEDFGRRVHAGPDTDLIAMNVPLFMTKTPAALLEMLQAGVPRPVKKPSLFEQLKALLTMVPLTPIDPGETMSSDAGVLEFARKYHPANAYVLESSMLSPPTSYLRSTYYAVHAFDVEGNDGTHRWGRFFFEPADGVRVHPESDAPMLDPDYLGKDLLHRSAEYPSRFNLRMQLADPWDDPTDPTTMWPQNRQRVLMGTLRLWAPPPDVGIDVEKMSFNPGRLVPGIGMSDDPTLWARVGAYNESQRMRGADICPVTLAGREGAVTAE